MAGSFRERIINRRLEREQRERLGLNLKSLVAAAKKLKAEDRITGDETVDAASILQEVINCNEAVFQDEDRNTGIDFDAILEWIEALLPIIMLILSLFGL